MVCLALSVWPFRKSKRGVSGNKSTPPPRMSGQMNPTPSGILQEPELPRWCSNVPKLMQEARKMPKVILRLWLVTYPVGRNSQHLRRADKWKSGHLEYDEEQSQLRDVKTCAWRLLYALAYPYTSALVKIANPLRDQPRSGPSSSGTSGTRMKSSQYCPRRRFHTKG